MRRSALAVAAAGEGVTGLALLVSPSSVVPLLFGAELGSAGVSMCRIAGIALIALGVACWPGPEPTRTGQAYAGMLLYTVLAGLVLVYVGVVRESTGELLWPAAVVHGILAVALGLGWFGSSAAR